MKTKVLFLCIHNSARSQIAEAYLRYYGGNIFEAESAGIEPGELNPFAIEVMKEEGIDLSGNSTNDVFDFYKQGKIFQYVITVCDPQASASCPIFPGMVNKINWGFPDPSKFEGDKDNKLALTRQVRDQIKKAVLDFIEKYGKE